MAPQIIRFGETLELHTHALEVASAALRGGEIALLPAEGVYGLHAGAFRPQSASRLDALKSRATARTYIVLVATPAHALPLVARLPGAAADILENVWPAPLTLLLPASPLIPPHLVRDGLVALRCPQQRFLRELLLLLEEPLLSTSANESGAPSPRTVDEVAPAIRDACAVVVDAGPLTGIGSTLARPEPDGTLTILRRGLWVPQA
jgi:L-threonylcarbamoyladenylate synthase